MFHVGRGWAHTDMVILLAILAIVLFGGLLVSIIKGLLVLGAIVAVAAVAAIAFGYFKVRNKLDSAR